MKEETIFTNARIVLRGEVVLGTLVVREGLISALDGAPSQVSGAVDLQGDYLMPGLVELHTDNMEKHFVPRPGVRWPDMAAMLAHDAAVASSGITTVFDALALGDARENTERIRDLEDMVAGVRTGGEKGLFRSEHFLHLRCEVGYPDLIKLFEPLCPDPLVRMVSLMDHTPGQRQFTRLDQFYTYYQGKFHLTNEEMLQMIRERKENQAKYGIRHRDAVVKTCRRRGLPMASHDDTTVEHAAEAAGEGFALSEFPTTVEAAETARKLGLKVLMGAPNLVLGRSHSGNVSAMELGRFGLLDILSSDYVPMSLLHGAFRLHHELDWPLPLAAGVVSTQPAETAQLFDRGEVAIGKRADLIQVQDEQGLPLIKRVWRSGLRVC
jgi:alpha-D-ribose 1-methylphosphonate 5-triphosphate diphosphatase